MPYKDLEKAREYARERNRRYRAANPDGVREKNRRYLAANPEKAAEFKRRQREGNPVRHLWNMHGMRPEDRAAMVTAQEGRCCYCERPLGSDPHEVHIDHDHSCTCGPANSCTACRRGLACRDCNVLIGHAGDDPDRLDRIAANFRLLTAGSRERIAGSAPQEELPIDIRRARREAG